MDEPGEIRVWDLFVRLFHWLLVLAFAVCYLTEGKPRWLHVNAGYLIAGLIPLRVIWGFVGPRHARFSDFVRGPRAVMAHLLEVATFRARRYTGHDPAGGAMVVALLVVLALTVASGVLLYGVKDRAGPLAGFQIGALESVPLLSPPAADASKGERKGGHGGRIRDEREHALKEAHEILANLSLALVVLHIGGVVAVSLQTRENLVWSMITGKKRVTPD